MDDTELKMYEASSNKLIFIDKRNYYIYTPIVILFFFVIFTDISNTLKSYVNLILILTDVLTFLFMSSVKNDIICDLTYASLSIAYSLVSYNNQLQT